MHRSWVTSGQAELAVVDWGGDGTPIVALHPNIADSRVWRECAPAWVAAGYRVVSYDRRGFGQTRYAEEAHDAIEDLRAVTAATSCRPAVIVGNSRGGALALELAVAHPRDVLALVLIGAAPTGYPDEEWVAGQAESEQDALLEAAETAGDLDLVNRLEIRYWLDGTEQPEGRVGGPARDLMLEMNSDALRAEPIGEQREREPVWPRLAEVTVPVLVIAGGLDLPGLAGLSAQLTEALPDARLVTMAGSAHCPSMDRPEQLSRVVIDFLTATGHIRNLTG
ncbi:MAG TPA: alpha/beta hydrolase [Candidatus Lustribacter sp.]|nr:alpha/beta hydrolase [Candidatus Lustribacter sp.]